jgi:hypothetical protein
MAEALNTNTETFRTNDNVTQYIFTIASIAATDSVEITLETALKGIIKGIRVVSTSVDFDVSIRTESSLTVPSIKEIIKIEDINLVYSEVELLVPYICEEHLYAYITNTDAAHATGEFQLELLISIAG